jgi:hypothetical protein
MVGVETSVGFSFSLLCARMLGKSGDLGGWVTVCLQFDGHKSLGTNILQVYNAFKGVS